jgi:hypothetical protein
VLGLPRYGFVLEADPMEVYRHSGKMPLAGIPLTVVLGSLTAAVLGVVYGYAIVYDPIIYVNIMLTIGFGFTIGKAVSYGVRLGKIRNAWLAGAYGLAFGLGGVYMAWVADFWARVGLHVGLRALEPEVLKSYIGWFYENGFWTIGHGGGQGGQAVTGVALAAVWSVEASVIVGFAAWSAYKGVASTPFCETCNRWTVAAPDVRRLLAPSEAQGRLVAGDLGALAESRLATGREPWYLQLDLAFCPACGQSNFLSVLSVKNTLDEKGNPKVVKKTLLQHLVIAAADVLRVRDAGLAAEQGEATGSGPQGES